MRYYRYHADHHYRQKTPAQRSTQTSAFLITAAPPVSRQFGPLIRHALLRLLPKTYSHKTMFHLQ
jgi:hypothetical protein